MSSPSVIEMIIAFLIVLGPLILLHELGHFIVAKRGGIRVLEFGMGYPPRALRMWRGKGYALIDGVRFETPRNFDLPWDWQVYANKHVTVTYDEINGRAILRSIELHPEEEDALLTAEQDQSQRLQAQAHIAQVTGQAVETVSAPVPRRKRNVQMKHGAHELSGVLDNIDAGTEYTLNWLPLGGFVRMHGEEGATGNGSFVDAPKRWRAATLLAGPGMNIFIALVVFTLTYMVGYPETSAIVAEVSAGSPAQQAGLQAHDVITAVDNMTVRNINQIKPYVDDHAGQPIHVTVQRGDQQLVLMITPRTAAQTPPDQGKMGVRFDVGAASQYHLVQHPFGESITLALGDIADTVRQIVTLPTRLLGGMMAPSETQFVGPVGISQFAATAVEQTARTGEAFWFLNLFAAISLALAITNLLPLPALDGGRLIFVILEAIRGKRVAPEREALVHLIGMAVLLALMVLVTIQDVSRIISN